MINKKTFLNIICSNNNYASFIHYHNIAIMKYKYFQKLKEEERMKKSYDNILFDNSIKNHKS